MQPSQSLLLDTTHLSSRVHTRLWPYGVALLTGALSIFAFAPYRWYGLMPVLLAALLLLCWRYPTQRVKLAWVWGLAAYTTNFYWIYYSLHDIAGLPAPLALPLVLLFPAYLALYPMLAIGLSAQLSARNTHPSVASWLLGFPALWTLAEWLRGWIFTGFSWGELGYSQIPDSPLAGYAAIGGIHLVTALVAFSAAAIAWLIQCGRQRCRSAVALLIVILTLWLGGEFLKTDVWTRPAGRPMTVALAQGNIPQSLKWDPTEFNLSLDTYAKQVASSPANLIILPETALPTYLDALPANYLSMLRRSANDSGSELVTGVVMSDPDSQEYYNGVIALTSTGERVQSYRKNHLVPFGEFIPLPWLTGWLYRHMDIPMSGFARGGDNQAPMQLAGQRIAFNICYEDGFGEELLTAARGATVLANVSNLAWFGHSNAAEQHLQVAQARSLETGRPSIRATNTGMTAIIAADGTLQAVLAQNSRAVLSGTVQGRSGLTPYMRVGNWPVVIASLIIVLVLFLRRLTRDIG